MVSPLPLLSITLGVSLYLFFFNDTATTKIYTLSLHDALPISSAEDLSEAGFRWHHVCASGSTSYDLAAAATRQLAEAEVLEPVDAIVYATCLPCNGNLGDAGDWERTRDVKFLMDFPVSRLQADFGLDDAVAVGLN